jgi:hypothetical protein
VPIPPSADDAKNQFAQVQRREQTISCSFLIRILPDKSGGPALIRVQSKLCAMGNQGSWP